MCGECQKVNNTWPPQAPLQVMSITDTPFDHIAMDIVGPLSKSSAGHQFILVMVDCVTRYPGAVPLKFVMAPRTANKLLKCVSWMGIPCEILTEQGTNFMSGVMKMMCQLLKLKQ